MVVDNNRQKNISALKNTLSMLNSDWQYNCTDRKRVKIGLISDTHVRTINEIPRKIIKLLEQADLIIHTGDFTQKSVLDGLMSIGQVRAVYGNMDSAELKSSLPEKEIFEVNGKRLGLIHGWGMPWGLAERVRQKFSNVDSIIFGHSHETCNRFVQGVLMVNPGQAKTTFGLLTIDDDIKVEIYRV